VEPAQLQQFGAGFGRIVEAVVGAGESFVVGDHQLCGELVVALADGFEGLVGGGMGGIVSGRIEEGGGEREGFEANRGCVAKIICPRKGEQPRPNQARGQYERSFLPSESDENDFTYFQVAQVNVILQAIGSLHAYVERKAGEVVALLRHALRHSDFRYTVLSHQNSHGVSHQTARSDLQKLTARGLLIAGKDGRREVFRVPEDLAQRLPG
jgi:hypothetical protein